VLREIMACEDRVAVGMWAWNRLASADVKPVSVCWCWGSRASDGCWSGLAAIVNGRVPVGL
jgi:hypothetical protein